MRFYGQPCVVSHMEENEDADGESQWCKRAKEKRAKWCITCNCVKNYASAHASRAKGRHNLRDATEQELEAHFRQSDAATARCEAVVPLPDSNADHGAVS